MERDQKKSEKEKKGIEPTGTGSQIGMGGSKGLGGSNQIGAGSGPEMSSVSSGYENMPERGSTAKGSGAKQRRESEQL